MTEFIVKDTSRGNERECESRSEAQETRDDMISLGASPDDLVIESVGADGGTTEAEVVDAEPVDDAPEPTNEPAPDTATDPDDPLAELGEELGTDPLSILPGHMVDSIQGQPAVNKRGYAMIAERYGISVSAEVVEFPWENDENRCVARATATTDDGREYSGYGTACAEDGDMSDQIIELAETRSLKRAVSWASGVGIVSYQELAEELE